MAICIVMGACGGGTVPSAELPRTTDQNVSITMVESVETLPLPGCHSYWMTRNQEPPAGACEQTFDVRQFIAQLDTEAAETSVIGDPTFDPLYAMQLAARNLTEGVSVVVVVAPPNAAQVRLIDSTGDVVDRVMSTGGMVALAGLGPDLTVQAVADDGSVIAECPPDGVTLGGITYVCSLASGATIPITTTTLADGETP